MKHSVKPRVHGRLYKQMLVHATVGLYGHDGMWLKLSPYYFVVCNHDPCNAREYRGLCVLSITSPGKLHRTAIICLDSVLAEALLKYSLVF